MTASAFRKRIRSWYAKNGRRDLPWRRTRDPYRILVSEVMLQQTQVSRARRIYPEFLKTFPTVRALDRATLGRVLAAWQGMGYNRRALLLKKAARAVVVRHGGSIPRSRAALEALPGIGPGTAGAIRAFAFNLPACFIETNIRRVCLHFFFKDKTGVCDADILKKIGATLPARNFREWYWALMDYGALELAGKNAKISNPNRRSAGYVLQSKFGGSQREMRGRIISHLVGSGPSSVWAVHRSVFGDARKNADRGSLFQSAVSGLLRDGLIAKKQKSILHIP